MSRRLCHLALTAALVLTFGLLAAEDPAPAVTADGQAAAIKAQIAKLNADDMIAREDAERELLRIGAPALELLKEAANSTDPEIAARAKKLVAKLADMGSRPVQSYAENMPDSTVFFLEFPDARQTLERFRQTPLGKFWALPAMRKFYKGHYTAQLDDEQKLLTGIGEIAKLADGKALLTLGAPDTAEAAELDPPLVYVLETKQPQALEAQVRAVFETTGDAPKTTRRYGPFTVDEHITAQSVFGPEAVIHSLTQRGIEAFLDNRLKRPEKPLMPLLSEIRAQLPQYDCILHIGADGLNQLVEAGQLIDADQLKMLEALGFVPGSSYQSVLALNSDGAEEHLRLKLGGGEKNEGLLAVLQRMTSAPPPAAPAPQALDVVPWQAAILLSFNGDTAKQAAALTKAIRALDATTPPAPRNADKPKAAAHPTGQGATKAPQTQETMPKAKTPAQEVVAPVTADNTATAKPDAPAPQPAAPAVIYPHLTRLEKLGLKLEPVLEQVQGPVQMALFPEKIEGEAPDTLPLLPLIAMVLKDTNAVEQTLDTATTGPTALLRKEVLNGGAHYVEVDGDPEKRPGFWLKGNYLLYSTSRLVLDLSGLALLHQNGNERMTDRVSYKQALAAKRLDPNALLTVFGDADQILDLPYRLAKVNWEEDAENPWPDYALVKPLLQGKSVILQLKVAPEGLQGYVQSPLSLALMIEAFLLPLKEAGF